MELLRIYLLSGMVLRRFLWEALRNKDGMRPSKKQSMLVVKAFKISVQAFLIVQTLFLEVFPISSQPANIKLTGVSLFTLALAVTMAGRLHLGKNWANIEDYQVMQGQSLVSDGIYRYIRHPIYTGDLLLFIGLQLALNSWLVLGALAIIPIIVRQASREEHLLSEELQGYAEYCRRTKRFIPYII